MATTEFAIAPARKPLRLWPGVIAVVLQWLGWFLLPKVLPQAVFIGLLMGVFGGLAILLWWLFFSRAPWLERIGAPVLMVVALILTKRVVHASIAGGGMGMLLYVLAIPIFSMALVAWAVLTRRFTASARRLALLVTTLLACSVFMVIRTGGLTAEFDNDIHWRWSKTPEQRLLAQASDDASAPAAAAATTGAGNSWSGFRGPQRDSVVHGVKIKTDWIGTPPVQLWRRPIGPAWSSFAVQDGRLYTQEQLG